MKAKFKNIGPVHEAELDLKDLTIIAGANNTGKTYLTYTLYGFLRFIREVIFSQNMISEIPFDINKASQSILESGSVEYSIKGFEEKSKQVVSGVFRIFPKNIADIFSAPQKDFVKTEFGLYSDIISQGKRESVVRFGLKEKRSYRLTASYVEGILSFKLNPLEPDFHQEAIEDMLVAAFTRLCMPDFPDPFILSSERFGISLFYKELDFTKNRLVETLQKLKDLGSAKNIDPFFLFMEQASSRYAKPIKDNIDFTRDIARIRKQKSELIQSKDFCNKIKKIMGGSFKEKNGEIRFVSTAKKNKYFNIPLHLASSSARGLSDFYFYLAHIASRGQLLIIDEPESHLSPTNQIELARLLALCVNAGVKVFITTHSDYMVKEFNNLVMLSHDFSGKDRFLKKYSKHYGDGVFLKPDSVAAYVCENGTLTACEVDQLGLNMPVFDQAIDQINKIANELALSVEQSWN